MSRQRHALLLGVNEYRDPEIHPLVAAKADALAMYVFLLTKLRFDRAELVEPENGSAFLDSVERSAAELGPEDLLVVFYAGHGFEVNHKHYLLTPADRISRLRADLGSMHKEALVHAMRGRGCHRVLITDSCRSPLTAQRGGSAVAGSIATDRDLGRKEAEAAGGSLTLFNACDEGKTAAEMKEMKAGLFSRSLLEVWESRLEAGRAVTIDTDVQVAVAARMRETASRHGLEGDQWPWLMSSGQVPALSEGGPSGAAAPAPAWQNPPREKKRFFNMPPPPPDSTPVSPRLPPLEHGGRGGRIAIGILLFLLLSLFFKGLQQHPAWTPFYHHGR